MKLRHSHTSPYVRKVMMVAIETGQATLLTLEPTDPWAPNTTLTADNPLSKVPTLVTDDGLELYDSPVICEYLDARAGGRLFPPASPARWKALRFQALGDGICDAGVARRVEATQRPESQRSPAWDARQAAAVNRALDVLDASVTDLSGPDTIGTFAVLAALGYLDFRFAADAWRTGRPRLADWFAQASDRPSFRDSAPPV